MTQTIHAIAADILRAHTRRNWELAKIHHVESEDALRVIFGWFV